jgi:anhydro-N-acetylmuramic acid kinase
MLVAGIMSGTSADGINVALVRCFGRGLTARIKLVAHRESPFPKAVRNAVLAAMNSTSASVADLSRLSVLLAELYAEAVIEAEREAGEKCDLVGCHGQTLYHQGEAATYLGRKIACTWQTGEASVLAARVGAPVVSDFRPADMAAAGKGAPLVPYFDFLLYRHRTRGRIVQNIGGIGNLTAIPAKALPEQVIAFDTGPGNMVIDAVTAELFNRPMDRDGAFAAKGTLLDTVVSEVINAPYFRRKPPKTAGREQFGREFVEWLLARCRRCAKHDVVATATAITARSIAIGVRLAITEDGKFRDFIASGGGTRNLTLMRMIAEHLAPMKLKVSTTDDHGFPGEAKEAAAFALLAYQTWHRQPSNVPSATGAARPAILGKVTYV